MEEVGWLTVKKLQKGVNGGKGERRFKWDEMGKLQGCPCESRAGEGILVSQREAQGIFQKMPSLSVRLMSLALRGSHIHYLFCLSLVFRGFQRDAHFLFIHFIDSSVSLTLDGQCQQVKNGNFIYGKWVTRWVLYLTY